MPESASNAKPSSRETKMTLSNPLSSPLSECVAASTHTPDIGDARKVSRFILVLIIGFLLFILLAFRQNDSMLWDPDSYWHVMTGQKIWETGSLPHADEFSYTFLGHPWTADNWLAELMMFGAYSLGGWRGLVLLTTCAAVFSYALLFVVLSRKMRLTVAIGVVAGAFAFSTGHFSARPQIFVDGLMVLWAAGLVNAVESKSSPPLLLLPIAALWANLHLSVTFGLALAAALAAEACLYSPRGERIQTAKRWAPFLALAVAATCLTPYGYAPLLHSFQLGGNEAVPYVQEWTPVKIQTLGINELILLALLFLAMHQGVRIPAWRLLMAVGLFYSMMAHIRFASLFAFVTPILLAPSLERQFPFLRLSTHLEQDPRFFAAIGRIARRGFYLSCALVLCGTVAYGVWGPAASPKAEITPAGAVDYMYREQLTGNIYNPYNFGGYLIFRSVKTFIDGRTVDMGGFTKRLFDILQKYPRNFMLLLTEYKISLALVVPGSIESQELGASDSWEKVYSDKVAELYKRRD
jgi:hypothetical protein